MVIREGRPRSPSIPRQLDLHIPANSAETPLDRVGAANRPGLPAIRSEDGDTVDDVVDGKGDRRREGRIARRVVSLRLYRVAAVRFGDSIPVARKGGAGGFECGIRAGWCAVCIDVKL